MKSLADNIFDLFFPPRCMACNAILSKREAETGLCRSCKKRITPVKEPFCKKCGKPLLDSSLEFCEDCEKDRILHSYVQGRAVYLYSGEMREIMYRYKYKNKREYSRYFAKAAKKLHLRWIQDIKPDIIIPVPMHAKKKRLRGYDQAGCFAKALSKELSIPYGHDILIRKRATLPQKGLQGAARRLNLKNAFHIRGNLVQSQRILLVDDIYTTGTTIDECARALQKAGAVQVFAMYICAGDGTRRRKK